MTAEALPLVRTATERGHVNRSAHLAVLLAAKRAKDLSEDKAITESFVVVQRAASTAASAALSQLAVRFAAGTDELAQLVRKDQDLSAENERLDKDLLAAFAKPPNQRDANREAATRKRLAEIADARAEVGRILAASPCESGRMGFYGNHSWFGFTCETGHTHFLAIGAY